MQRRWFLAHIHTWLLSASYSFQFKIAQGTVLKSSWAPTVVSRRESFLFLIQCCLKITSIHFWPLTLSLSLQCGRHNPQSHGNLTLSNLFLHVFLSFRCSLLHFGQPLPISTSERLLLDPEPLLSYLIGSQLLLQLFFISPSSFCCSCSNFSNMLLLSISKQAKIFHQMLKCLIWYVVIVPSGVIISAFLSAENHSVFYILLILQAFLKVGQPSDHMNCTLWYFSQTVEVPLWRFSPGRAGNNGRKRIFLPTAWLSSL